MIKYANNPFDDIEKCLDEAAKFREMLSPYRVLDLSDERGHLCGHVLAALGRGEIAASRHRIYLELREELGRTRW